MLKKEQLDSSLRSSEQYNSEGDSFKQQDQDNQANSFKKSQNYVEYDGLFKAKDRFEEFLEELGEKKYRPIDKKIIEYYQNSTNSKEGLMKGVNFQSISNKIDQRIKKMIHANKKVKGSWMPDDVQIFIWIAAKYYELHHYSNPEQNFDDEDWEFISSLIPGSVAERCKFKWISFKKANIQQYKWSTEQTDLFCSIIKEEKEINKLNVDDFSSHIWNKITYRLYQETEEEKRIFRSQRQCKEHWKLFIDETIKKSWWEPEEDYTLFRLIQEDNGRKKWTLLAKKMIGRKENAIKNRFTLLSKKVLNNCLPKLKKKLKDETELIQYFIYQMELSNPLFKQSFGKNKSLINENALIQQNVEYINFGIEEKGMLQRNSLGGIVKLQEFDEESSQQNDEGNKKERKFKYIELKLEQVYVQPKDKSCENEELIKSEDQQELNSTVASANQSKIFLKE